jgi:ferredoxin
MGIHEWAYSNDYNPAKREKMKHVDLVERFKKLDIEVELGFTAEQTAREVERCLNCDVQTVFTKPLCIECDACVDICPVLCLTITTRTATPRRPPHCASRRRRSTPSRRSTSPPPLPQTKRVMVKDEDVCVHCGLCAERCPTAAWDMRTFDLQAPLRRGQRARAKPMSGSTTSRSSSERQRHRVGERERLLMQAIFRMGIPVSGKNLFPSNIQGLPTWYEIRVSKDGYTARTLEVRPDGRDERGDLRARRRRGALRRLPPLRLDVAARPALVREGITFLGVPFGEMCNERLRGSRATAR